MPRLALHLLLALVLAGGLSACDSNDEDDPDPRDVAGTYTVSTYTFDPDIGVLDDVSVLDTLNASATSVEILGGGQVILRYELQNSDRERLVLGEASVRREQVRITFDDGTVTDRRRILLPNRVTFDREGSTLTSEQEVTLNLENFSPRYQSSNGAFRDVEGTLTITLTPRE